MEKVFSVKKLLKEAKGKNRPISWAYEYDGMTRDEIAEDRRGNRFIFEPEWFVDKDKFEKYEATIEDKIKQVKKEMKRYEFIFDSDEEREEITKRVIRDIEKSHKKIGTSKNEKVFSTNAFIESFKERETIEHDLVVSKEWLSLCEGKTRKEINALGKGLMVADEWLVNKEDYKPYDVSQIREETEEDEKRVVKELLKMLEELL